MTTTDIQTPHATASGPADWFARAEAWLDARGRGAWIAAMVLGFVLAWPVGLAILAYVIWSKRMSNPSSPSRWARGARCGGMSRRSATMQAPSGNAAFDAYRADTLRRLEEEQTNFESFLTRLREARDKAEFDQFMDERADRDDDGGDATAA